jgi:D-tyrosyl-tRNA(Tyr) deacylase
MRIREARIVRAVVQRVCEADVKVDGEPVGRIGPGLVVLVGVHANDTLEDAASVAERIVNLRIFEDDEGKMNRSLLETGGSALIVSQFTLWGDARKGRRPSFIEAASGASARPLYEAVCQRVEELGVPVQQGRFAAHMHVSLVNDGPVTILLDSRKAF